MASVLRSFSLRMVATSVCDVCVCVCWEVEEEGPISVFHKPDFRIY